MSKVDDLRAMREARYEASRPRATKPPAVQPPAVQGTPVKPTSAKPVPASKTPRSAPDRPEKAEAVPEPVTAGLCGHRAISGRTCTRELGHAVKSHRYS